VGIPYEDTPLGAFDDAMDGVAAAATRILAALDAAQKLVGPQTWVGNPATTWNDDFNGRAGKLRALLASIQPGGAEYNALRAKAQQDQVTFNQRTKTNSGG
jgi:type II secretory pathway component PulM